MTLISPEGAESDDFSVASDYEAPVSSKTGGTTTPDDQLLPLNDPNPSQPGTCEFVAGSDDHALVPESDFVHKLSLLNGTVTPDKQLGETQSIPALFVFGGMDTHETVHGDSFVFVPN